ncbi:FAD-dependent oxidoreductase [Saccharomonospora sp. NPDC046836]|uniref:FAD-dependent oxidoreductase n=1 Tax=Saccharomonospora sp. NPDC046836 TaxID=3156921 RepID=UPI0033DAB6E2
MAERCVLAVVGAGLTLWATGFVVTDLAAGAGLAVDKHGRIQVDGTMRSVSHPDVYVVGDSAAAHRRGGQLLRMACAIGLPMGLRAAEAIADREPAPLRFRYLNQCVSLGRRDGLIQYVAADDSPHGMVLTGRNAAWYKEVIVRSAAWTTANSGPYVPSRRRRWPLSRRR